MAEMKNCSKVLYFEGRKKKDLFLTVADVEEGPTIRFNVEGLNTMGELKFSGNSLKVLWNFSFVINSLFRHLDHYWHSIHSLMRSHTGRLWKSSSPRLSVLLDITPSHSHLLTMWSISRFTTVEFGCETIRLCWRERTRSRRTNSTQSWSKSDRELY